jgi:hypothetical protein
MAYLSRKCPVRFGAPGIRAIGVGYGLLGWF